MNSYLEINKIIRELEKRLAKNPSDKAEASRLISVLDCYTPSKKGFGKYTQFQQNIGAQFRKYGSPYELLKYGKVAQYIKHSLSLLDSMNVNPPVTMNQLNSGTSTTVNGEELNCGIRMLLFKEENIISRACQDCYKVQILPQDLAALMHTHFIIRGLKLPRDNAGKCMIELREDIPNPYKGYIYCESENEAMLCLELVQKALNTFGISNVYCGISHGCSEYGQKYPEYKYSSDGTHRLFERPASWDQTESEFISRKPIEPPQPHWADYSNQRITIKDIVAFRAWVNYAEIIGDDSCKIFLDKSTPKAPEYFTARIRMQAQQRRTEMDELKKRISSSA